jgi:drug/metabolite transporter (DMT)-like permease
VSEIALILATVTAVILGQLMLKTGVAVATAPDDVGMDRPVRLLARIVSTPLVVLGLLTYFVSALGWVFILSRVDLSFAYPFLGLSYAGVTAGAVFIMGERFTARQWIGLGAVVLGVVLVAATG